MGWQDQGRQEHGWFGHGAAPAKRRQPAAGAGPLFDPANPAARIDAVGYAALANMSVADRRRPGASFDRQRLARLRTAMTAWMGAGSLSRTDFADRFVDPSTSDAAVDKLRAAAEGARTATTHGELADASAVLAGAMQAVGLEKWPRFLADAAGRAEASQPSGHGIVLAQLTAPDDASDAGFRSRFEAATASAYARYSHDCSHYLQDVLINTGHPDTPYRTANGFMAYVPQPGSGWKRVTTAEEAVRLSAAGHIVVAGLAQSGGSGHVAVVGPRMIPARTVPGHPMSPQVFSGGSSGWPGVRSQGEYSVADSWPRNDRGNVTYWVKQ